MTPGIPILQNWENQAEIKSTSVTYSLNWMLPFRHKEVAGTLSDVEDNFVESKEAGRKRKTTQN